MAPGSGRRVAGLRRILSALGICLAALALAACGGEGGSEREAAVSLSVEPETVRAGGRLELTIANGGSATLGYGLPYDLLRRQPGGDYARVPLDMAFIQILRLLPPGQSQTQSITLPGDLEPGNYELRKSFSVQPGEGSGGGTAFTESAPLEVVAGGAG